MGLPKMWGCGSTFGFSLPSLWRQTNKRKYCTWRIYDLWIMDAIQVTKVPVMNYVCEHLINEISDSINKSILEEINKNMNTNNG